jgi:ABC-type branched-subunit amino acid transport system ATPase component
MLLRTRALHGGYHSVPAVHGVDLTVDRGEVVALLGTSAGASTRSKRRT